MLFGMAVAVAAIWAIATYWPKEALTAIEEPMATSVPAQPETLRGFASLDGPPPGSDTPYKGTLVAWVRWKDIAGEHLVILSRATATLEALHYSRNAAGFELRAEHSAMPNAAVPEAAAAFFRDGIRSGDADGDGLGEAMFAYYLDEAPGPGPKSLSLISFSGDKTLSIHGRTRFDPVDGSSVAPVTRLDDDMSAAPEALRSAALELWAEAQFDLAEPPAYPGFFPHRRFDGATFSGDEPFWTLTILPQYLILKLASEKKASVIRYETIRADGSGLIIEGKGEIEAWSHAFRVTIIETPVTAPHGELFPFTATIDWSDGTRLSGWGSLAADRAEQYAP